MGNFYSNYTAYGVSQSELASLLSKLGRDAYIAPTVDNVTVFYDAESEQKSQVIGEVGRLISKSLACPLLAVDIHDDDILLYSLFLSGEVQSNYNSNPGYFTDGDTTPVGADVEALCKAFEKHDEETIDEIDAALAEEDGYVFASERHQDLAMWLGIPWQYGWSCYSNISRGEFHEDVTRSDFVKTNLKE